MHLTESKFQKQNDKEQLYRRIKWQESGFNDMNRMWRKRIYFCCVVFYSYKITRMIFHFFENIFLLTKQKQKNSSKLIESKNTRTNKQTNKHMDSCALLNRITSVSVHQSRPLAVLCCAVPCRAVFCCSDYLRNFNVFH